MSRNLWRNKKGQGMVEYGIIVAGVALAGLLAVSLLGEKTGDLIAAIASVLPGADSDDNGSITVGHLIEDVNTGGTISMDINTIATEANTPRLGANLGGTNTGTAFGGLITDPIQSTQ